MQHAPFLLGALAGAFFIAPVQAAEPPKPGDSIMVQSFCWTPEPAREMAAFAAAGDSESETMRAVRALEAAECVYAKVPFPAVIVAVEDRSLTEDGSAIYVLAVRPYAQAVIVFGTRLVKPEPA